MTTPESTDDPISHQELEALLAELNIQASPEQLRAILAFIEEAGGIEEAQELLTRLNKAA
ncbi:MAG: hypothetical protein U0935_14370 [Pirellulales bacterium]